MKVTDLLKGKNAYQKEMLLDNKEATSELVDKLASDSSKKVRYKAVNHKNLTSKGAWKVVTQKKNFKEEYILGLAFEKLTAEQVVEWFAKEFDKNIDSNILNSIRYDIMSSLRKDKPNTKKVLNIFVDRIVNDDFYQTWYVKRVLDGYPVLKNKELLQIIEKKYPAMLIRYRDEIKLTKKQEDEYFKMYIKTKHYWQRPVDDLGCDYIENLSSDKITLLINNITYPTQEALVSCLLSNENFNASHTEVMLGEGNTNDNNLITIIKDAPLNDKCEKIIYNLFSNPTDKGYKGWRYLEALALNKTHNKKKMIKTIEDFDEDDGFSIQLIENLISSKQYSEKEIESIIDNQSDYTQFSINIDAVKQDGFPKKRLRELWEKYWKGEWKSKEIPGPTTIGRPNFKGWNMSYEQGRVHELIYNLVKYSSLSGEFGLEYYEVLNDDKFLPEAAKDIFLF